MRKIHTVPRKSALIGLALLALLSVGLLVVGCARYGGIDGVVRRARAELAPQRSHPLLVPTPLTAAAFPPASTVSPTPVASVERSATPVILEATAEPTASQQDDVQAGAPADPHDGASSTPTPPTTSTATPTVEPTATATPVYAPAAPSVALTGLRHAWQTWNNCGPATLSFNLSYYGSTLTQADIAAVLRPHPDDKNVAPEEMAAFARSQGYQALVRRNGDADRLRLLLSNGVPVLIETWLEPEPNDGMGHYRLLTGYIDGSREWIAYDSYVSTGLDRNQPYAGIRMPYDELDRLWAVFNRTYLVIYTEQEAPLVASILGEDMDDATMWQRALEDALLEVQERPEDSFAWFNLGSDYVATGQYEQAAAAYDRARQIGLPWRMLWYQFGPFRAYTETGRHQEVLALADATLQTVDTVEEIYYWKGKALHAQGDVTGAVAAWDRALQLNPTHSAAEAARAAAQP